MVGGQRWRGPVLAAALLGLVAAWLWADQGSAGAVLWLLGAALGLSLFHASFGFTAAFQQFLSLGRGAGLRAQMVMLAVTCLLFLPAIAAGSVLGQPVRGFVFPVGLALLLGAFLFGIGMQLGGGCASGTLYSAGGGAARMWLTLAAFIAGATLATWQYELWQGWPALAPVSLPDRLGSWPALLLSLGIFGLVFLGSALWERARRGDVEPLAIGGGDWLRGPWPLLWGALALALLNFATLATAGRPWAITAAFPLWGSKLIDAVGWDDPAFWTFWEDPTRTEALLRPLHRDRITIMDIGLMGGAALAASLAGRGTAWRLPRPGEIAGSLVGGLLLGIGAMLATGCNISAYVGGVASGSLHGWAWILPALAGNWVGLRLRPILKLDHRAA